MKKTRIKTYTTSKGRTRYEAQYFDSGHGFRQIFLFLFFLPILLTAGAIFRIRPELTFWRQIEIQDPEDEIFNVLVGKSFPEYTTHKLELAQNALNRFLTENPQYRQPESKPPEFSNYNK